MKQKKSLLFVYGSLKRGQPNHQLLASAGYLGEARTADGYSVLELGPYLALVLGGNDSVVGELFAVEPSSFDALDAFEGAEYVRSRLVLADGRSAFAYFAADRPLNADSGS